MQRRFKILQKLAIAIAVLAYSGWLALPAAATSPAEVPDISSSSSQWVVDTAEVISRTTEQQLNRALKTLARETDQQLRLVVFRRLDYGLSIETFADELFARWYPDAEARAQQTLLVLDTVTNNIAARTGSGELLTPEIVDSTLSENIGQQLREGDKYNQAFEAGIARFAAVLAGNPDPGPPTVEDDIQVEGTFISAEDADTEGSTFWVVVLLVLATAIPMATYYGYVLLTRD